MLGAQIEFANETPENERKFLEECEATFESHYYREIRFC